MKTEHIIQKVIIHEVDLDSNKKIEMNTLWSALSSPITSSQHTRQWHDTNAPITRANFLGRYRTRYRAIFIANRWERTLSVLFTVLTVSVSMQDDVNNQIRNVNARWCKNLNKKIKGCINSKKVEDSTSVTKFFLKTCLRYNVVKTFYVRDIFQIPS